MTLWKKVIFYTLSAITLFLTACNNKPLVEEKEVPSQTELVSQFFSHFNEWSSNTVDKLDSLGIQIATKDSILEYHSFTNDYQKSTFIFSSKERSTLKVFEESNFLKKETPVKYDSYLTWRKNLDQRKILDCSIEPHPTLKWLFTIRLRGQE